MLKSPRGSAASLYADLSHPVLGNSPPRPSRAAAAGRRRAPAGRGRLAKRRHDDPAFAELIWLAAAGGSDSGARPARPSGGRLECAVRLQAVRALHEFFGSDSQASRRPSRRSLTDADPRWRWRRRCAFFDASPVPLESIAAWRALDGHVLAAIGRRECSPNGRRCRFLKAMLHGRRRADAARRRAGSRFSPDASAANEADSDPSLPLAPWPTGDVYRVQVSRRNGRLAQARPHRTCSRWPSIGSAAKHAAEQEALFALLRERLDDSERTRPAAGGLFSVAA